MSLVSCPVAGHLQWQGPMQSVRQQTSLRTVHCILRPLLLHTLSLSAGGHSLTIACFQACVAALRRTVPPATMMFANILEACRHERQLNRCYTPDTKQKLFSCKDQRV